MSTAHKWCNTSSGGHIGSPWLISDWVLSISASSCSVTAKRILTHCHAPLWRTVYSRKCAWGQRGTRWRWSSQLHLGSGSESGGSAHRGWWLWWWTRWVRWPRRRPWEPRPGRRRKATTSAEGRRWGVWCWRSANHTKKCDYVCEFLWLWIKKNKNKKNTAIISAAWRKQCEKFVHPTGRSHLARSKRGVASRGRFTWTLLNQTADWTDRHLRQQVTSTARLRSRRQTPHRVRFITIRFASILSTATATLKLAPREWEDLRKKHLKEKSKRCSKLSSCRGN